MADKTPKEVFEDHNGVTHTGANGPNPAVKDQCQCGDCNAYRKQAKSEAKG
jgi:hypothetical protein